MIEHVTSPERATQLNGALRALARFCLLPLAVILVLAHVADAHELRPAYLEIRQNGETQFDVLWKVSLEVESKKS